MGKRTIINTIRWILFIISAILISYLLLLEKGINPNFIYINCSLLSIAIQMEYKTIVKLLLVKGSDPKKKNRNGFNSLATAVLHAHRNNQTEIMLPIIRLLIKSQNFSLFLKLYTTLHLHKPKSLSKAMCANNNV